MTPDLPDYAVTWVPIIGWAVSTFGCVMLSRERRGKVAAARASQTEAETKLREAEAVWSRKEVEAAQVLADAEQRLTDADGVLLRTGAQHDEVAAELRADCTRMRELLATAHAAAGVANERRKNAEGNTAVALAELYRAYVRVGPAFKRWRADGVYAAAEVAEHSTPAAEMATGASQEALEGKQGVSASPNPWQPWYDLERAPQGRVTTALLSATQAPAEAPQAPRLAQGPVEGPECYDAGLPSSAERPGFPVHAIGDPEPARPDGVAMQEGE